MPMVCCLKTELQDLVTAVLTGRKETSACRNNVNVAMVTFLLKDSTPILMRVAGSLTRFKVEYAIEAIKLGSTAVGIQTKEGVVLAVEKRLTSPLLEPSSVEKVRRGGREMT